MGITQRKAETSGSNSPNKGKPTGFNPIATGETGERANERIKARSFSE
jgi:hypothetical protein